MKAVTIQLEDRELEIKRLPLKKYAELLAAVQELPKRLGNLDSLDNDQIFEQMPSLIATSLPDVIAILTIATDLQREEIEEMGLNDAIKVVAAVIEVNDYKEVFEQIKKMLAQTPKPTPAPLTG
jgi:hypothetical protein